jgi:6-phosphogluconate dehydrogenase
MTATQSSMTDVVNGEPAYLGLVGLGVMGENLALNVVRNGFPVSVFNRTTATTDEFLAQHTDKDNLSGQRDIPSFVASLQTPRRILLMVKAGAPVDAVIAQLEPYLEAGDIVIDGGNSLFTDTDRRAAELEARGFRFIGMGVSGGEEGALYGPSLMPGGPAEGYAELEPMLTAIAAKTEAGACVTHIGPGGSGHYVKMVHNGIEYGDMQLIAETYDIMRRAMGLSAHEMAEVYRSWNLGKLESFLIETTATVLDKIDPETGKPLVDVILDAAEQKGTGRWTSQNALELGTPIPTIDAAVMARSMSSRKAERVRASEILHGPEHDREASTVFDEHKRHELLGTLEDALYVAKVSSYAQGLAMLSAASVTYDWNLNLAEIARIWKGGCIIRARLLDPIREAFGNPASQPENLLVAPDMVDGINAALPALRRAVVTARAYGIPCPALSAALDYVDTYRTANLPANLIQGQRDYFGAHTYRRNDQEGIFHTEWMEPQGPAAEERITHS